MDLHLICLVATPGVPAVALLVLDRLARAIPWCQLCGGDRSLWQQLRTPWSTDCPACAALRRFARQEHLIGVFALARHDARAHGLRDGAFQGHIQSRVYAAYTLQCQAARRGAPVASTNNHHQQGE